MSSLTDLIRQARTENPALGGALEKEFLKLRNRRSFGLVFEAHQPEAVELPLRSPRRGDKVRVLPPRGEAGRGDQTLWGLVRTERTESGRVAHLRQLDGDDVRTAPVDDLVVVSEFSDPMYPGLVETGRVERGGDKPFHTVINAENFHALEMLTYTHRHSVDCIYIDPPYNTGAKDWKYNNDYVEADDDYRHSKWLSFMERRLKIARELLNPDDSVLIVTIDEKEYLRLGMLLEQTFPEARIQMISANINVRAVARSGEFGRVNEFIFLVQMGDSSPAPQSLDKVWLAQGTEGKTVRGAMHWASLSRTDSTGYRRYSPGGFYPIYVSLDGSGIHSVGEPLAIDADVASAPEPPTGTIAVWPRRSDGQEGRWQISSANARELIRNGFMRSGPIKKDRAAIYYVKKGDRDRVASGEYVVVGREADGSLVTKPAVSGPGKFVPPSVWNIPAHDAGVHGSRLLEALIGKGRFSYPKSLYAVEDTLRFFVSNKPQALILDFFSGSGTTAHAVMRLNKQDGGRRQCISVTNNEVSAEEQKNLRKQGLRPGDSEWEALGICDYVTKPRVRAAITGQTPAGAPIKGAYKFTDEFPMVDGFEENAAFFTLTYEDPRFIGMNRAFQRIAPMLWLRAGAEGRVIDDLGDRGWDVSDVYAVIHEPTEPADFVEAVTAAGTIRTAFIVTDSTGAFERAAQLLPEGVVSVRLYESYLHNFTINRGA